MFIGPKMLSNGSCFQRANLCVGGIQVFIQSNSVELSEVGPKLKHTSKNNQIIMTMISHSCNRIDAYKNI